MVMRLRGVRGLQARRNDVVFAPASRSEPAAPHTLVFWGGDVQDYTEVMQTHRENHAYLKWNLEGTAQRLSQSFPTDHIVVVRPSRIEYKSFSCYDNFVPSNKAGVPDHTPSHGALLHLQKLLQEASRRIKVIPEEKLLEALDAAAPTEDTDIEHSQSANQPEESGSNTTGAEASASCSDEPGFSTSATSGKLWWRRGLSLHSARLRLVGFSKGCVVLNQLVHELHYTADKQARCGSGILRQMSHLLLFAPHDGVFISNIKELYWLDGGHSGGADTWLTSRCLLVTLAQRDIDIFVHVSPYQVKDPTRPWIGREERSFTAILRQLGARIHRRLHNEKGALPSLHMHFGVLDSFHRQPAPSSARPDAPDSNY